MVEALGVEQVRIGREALTGDLVHPLGAIGLVVFVHGSSSNRLSPRNRWVAHALNRRGLATLLFDLLTAQEAAAGGPVFDIEWLTTRLLSALDWLRQHDTLAALRVGLFGASTGAAAALQAAAERSAQVAALVARGGRPDLVREQLPRVEAPTLLIVGGNDSQVLALNRAALALLHCKRRLEVVPGAGHLFDEPGALEAVADLAGDWFGTHLARRSPP